MITNIIGEIGDFAARIAWHLVLFIINLLVSAIQGLAAFMFPMITAVFTTIMTTTGMSTLCQPITTQMAPYWNNVAVIVNFMASTFVGQGTLQFCLSAMLETLCFACVLRLIFTIYALIPIFGKKA